MILYKTEDHEFNGQNFQIQFFNRSEKYQRIHVLFTTQRGTWFSQLDISIEMMDSEPLWKDYMCAKAILAYEKRMGQEEPGRDMSGPPYSTVDFD